MMDGSYVDEAPAEYSMVDQQQQLLEPGTFPHIPASTAHLAEKIERGGEKIEDTLTRLNCRYQALLFVASICVVVAGILEAFIALFRLEPAYWVVSIFQVICGFALAVLEIPGTPTWAGRYRKVVRKHARFLTRQTGKSVWLIYLGSLTTLCLWPRKYQTSAFLLFLAIFLSFFVNLVAFLGLFVALRKSLRLERLRQSLQTGWPDVYRKYAVLDPTHGMRYQEFNRMASDYSQGQIVYCLSDLHIIYNALDEHQKAAINEAEFEQWVCSRYQKDADGWQCGSSTWGMVFL